MSKPFASTQFVTAFSNLLNSSTPAAQRLARRSLNLEKLAQRRLCVCPRPQGRAADRHLAGFNGILQVDGYAGYPKLAERGDVELAFCWAHMRRNFYDLAIPGPAPIASEALRRIAEFYAIEKDIRGRSAEERRLIRQQKGRPLADTFEQWLHAKLALISPKGKLPDAVRSIVWKAMTGGYNCALHQSTRMVSHNIERA